MIYRQPSFSIPHLGKPSYAYLRPRLYQILDNVIVALIIAVLIIPLIIILLIGMAIAILDEIW